MNILENNEPRFHDGKFMGYRVEKDGFVSVVIATIIFPSSDQNRATCKDLGYEVTDNDDIELEINCSSEFDDEIPTLEQLLDYEIWTKIIDNPDLYKDQMMEIPKRELSKFLCEFFLPIVDGRR